MLKLFSKKLFQKAKKTNKLEIIIDKGSEIGGSITGAAIGLVIAGPAGAIGGAAVGPLVAMAFKKIGTEISELILSPREMARIGATYTQALEKIAYKIETGKELRNDDFFSGENKNRSYYDTILEGTLLKARGEYEEKKIKYYSNFIAELNFDQSISFEKGNTLLKMLEQLSYRQIAILAYFEEIDFLNADRWMVSFSRVPELGKFQDFYSELMNLYDRQLLKQAIDGIAMSVGTLKISPLGKTMCNLLNTQDIELEDKDQIKKTIEEIDKLMPKK